MTPEHKADTAREFISAFQSGDLEQIRALFAPDATWWVAGTLPLSGTYRGRDSIVDDFLAGAFPLFTSLDFEVTNTFITGTSALVEWSATGRTTSGKHYVNHNAFILESEEGKIVHVREYLDTESLRAAAFS